MSKNNEGPTIRLDSRKQLEALRLAVQRELFGRESFRLKDEHQRAFRDTLREINGLLNPFSFFLDSEPQPTPQPPPQPEPESQNNTGPTENWQQSVEQIVESQGSSADQAQIERRKEYDRNRMRLKRERERQQRERKTQAQKARRRKQAAEREMRKNDMTGAAHAGESPYIVSHVGPNGRRRTESHELSTSITHEDLVNYMIDWFEQFNELPTKSDWNPYTHKQFRNFDRIRRFEESGGRQKWPTPDTLNKLGIDWDYAIREATTQIAGEEQKV